MADDAPKRVVVRGDLSKITKDLERSLSRLPKLDVLLNASARPPQKYTLPPHPSVRTTAEVKELNQKTDLLVQAMLDLIAVTRDEAESMKASNRRIVRLAVVSVGLAALVAVLTLVLVLR